MNEEKKEVLLFVFILLSITLLLVEGTFLIIQYSETNLLKKELKDQNYYFNLKNKELEEKINNLQNSLSKALSVIEKNFESLTHKIKGVQKESLEKIKEVQKEINKDSDFTELLKKVFPSIVSIKTDSNVGSGVLIHPDGYLITNYHVIKNALSATVKTYDGKEYPIKVIASDANLDLVILEIKANKKFPYLEFTEEMTVGERVIAIGNPGGLDFSATEGIISATERKGPNGVLYVQSDVPINPGNSGGPLINREGKILGINTMKVRGFEGVGFAVHSKLVKKMIEQNLRK